VPDWANFCVHCGKRLSATTAAPCAAKGTESRELAKERKRLRETFGTEPSEGDVRWGLLNRQRLTYAAAGMWEAYADVSLQMARQLFDEARYRSALGHYLEYAYLLAAIDYWGPDWVFHIEHHSEHRDAINELIEAIHRAAVSKDEVRALFVAQSQKAQSQRLPIPLPPSERCWASLEKALSSEKTRLGYYRGRHYTTYVEKVKELKRNGKLEEALELLHALLCTVENEANAQESLPPPWYYEQLCIIYRKMKDYEAEIETANRYIAFASRCGVEAKDFEVRREKAKLLLAKGRR